MKKLLVSLLAGLSLVGLVGCGEAPVDVETVIAKFDQVSQIHQEDLDKGVDFVHAQEINLEYEVEYEFTDEELDTPEFKEFMGMSKSKIKVMEKDELKKVNAVLDTLVEYGTNEDKEIEKIEYSQATRNTMIEGYSAIIQNMIKASEIVNELENFKMHPEEKYDFGMGYTSVYFSLEDADKTLTEDVKNLEVFNQKYKFEDEVLQSYRSLQQAFHNFVVQYQKEDYPREDDSLTLKNYRRAINQEADKAYTWNINQLEGVAAPIK